MARYKLVNWSTCDRQGLIGRQMFAIDGVKLPSNAAKRRSGTQVATVEPVFANVRHNKRFDRFTLRTRPKVNTQWNLYCLIHNIEKLAHHGYAKRENGRGNPLFTIAVTKVSTEMQTMIQSIRDGTRRPRGKRLLAQLR